MAKTLEQKMCKRSLGYSFVRNFFVIPVIHLYYKRIHVIGKENVPDRGPVIFAPNHQNALMDALAILCTKDRQPVFVARADIFKRPLIIRILNFLRILPIFRKRDGGNAAANNQDTFDIILKVLDSQLAVGIMPEGTHSETKRLQTLQKGIFRLAMQAQEKYGNNPGVKIIPVGIDYSDPRKLRSVLTVKYGKAIDVSEFYGLYAENQARAFKLMQDTLSEKMKVLMIHIENEQYYDTIERISEVFVKPEMKKLGLKISNGDERLQTRKKIIAELHNYAKTNPDEMLSLGNNVNEYFSILEKHNLRDWVVEKQPYSLAGIIGRCLLMLLGLPLWILGMIFNYLPYKLSAFASSKIKDPQFISSVQFVAGLVLFPLFHIIFTVLMVIFIPTIWGKIIAPMTITPLGLFAYTYYLWMKKIKARFKFWAGKRNEELKKAVELRGKITDNLNCL